MTQYEQDVIRSAQTNHIWLNAFSCVNPTPELKIQLADQILAMLNDTDNLIYDDQDSENEALRALGKLLPQLVVRINKS